MLGVSNMFIPFSNKNCMYSKIGTNTKDLGKISCSTKTHTLNLLLIFAYMVTINSNVEILK